MPNLPRKKTNLVRTTVQIRDTQHETLLQLSGPGKSFSFLVREAIDNYLMKKSTDSIDEVMKKLNDYEDEMKSMLENIKAKSKV